MSARSCRFPFSRVGLPKPLDSEQSIRESRSTGFQPVSGEDRQDARPTRVSRE